MGKVKRFIVVALIIFFLLIILYSISGVAWLYFYDKTEFGNALSDEKSSFVAVGKNAAWEILLFVAIIFIWNIYRQRNKKPLRK